MSDTHHSSSLRRRYRVAQAAIVGGSLTVGTVVVSRLVQLFREDFFLFYGVSDEEYRAVQQDAVASLPLTVGQIFVASIALVAVCVFIASERRRVGRDLALDTATRRPSRELVQQRLPLRELFDVFVTRTSAFGGVLLALWLLQTSLERKLGGFGWGIAYVDWRSLLPLASVFGICVLAGMLVSAVSIVGLRAIHVLELVLVQIARGRPRLGSIRRPVLRVMDTARAMRALMGCDILSRPPPVAC